MIKSNVPKRINLQLDPEVAKALQIMAIKEGTPVWKLVGEAVSAWMTGLARITLEEYKAEDRAAERAAAEEDLREAIKLQGIVRTKDRAERIADFKRKQAYKKAVRSYKNWKRTFPDKPWPWFGEHKVDGTVSTGRKRGRPRKDSVPDITA